MAIKISALTEDTAPQDGDLLVEVDISANVTKKVTRKNLLKSATIITPTIVDTNENEIIKTATTASAVNEFTFTNAATGGDPSISATGGDTNIDIDLIPKGSGTVNKNGRPIDWYEELGRTTLGGSADTITVGSLANRKYLRILVEVINSGSINAALRFNADSGNNYSYRSSANGGADGTATSQSEGQLAGSNSIPGFIVIDVINVSTREKFAISHYTGQATGAGSAPVRLEGQVKWANTNDAISSVTIVNTSTGDFASGSQVIVLGHD